MFQKKEKVFLIKFLPKSLMKYLSNKYNQLVLGKELFRISNLEYVTLILRNCKKLKRGKIVRFKISSILSVE